ncbi:DUF2239 family protein [Dyella sp.]|uniref:DUF2239 family protein n=1 Tax=Dyella sp. TaxID=1869338 RepID=UPI002ED08569
MDGRTCTAFLGHRLIASGDLVEVARAVRQAMDDTPGADVLVFDDATSRQVEVDFRGSLQDVLQRLDGTPELQRGPGRPRLGVTAREVTLLPRHWQWLGAQPGGASAVLRRLVEDAIRHGGPRERARQAAEAADRFMTVMGGDFPRYEEASRAFWRRDRDTFEACVAAWPADVRDHLRKLAAAAWDEQLDLEGLQGSSPKKA